MWAGIVYGTLLERRGTQILLSGGAQIVLTDGAQCEYPVGTYLKVTYAETGGRKLAREIAASDSFHALANPPNAGDELAHREESLTDG